MVGKERGGEKVLVVGEKKRQVGAGVEKW